MSSLWRGESIYRDKTIPLVYFAGLSKLSLAKVKKTWPKLNLDWRIWGSPIISHTPKGIKYQAVMVSTTAKKSRKKFSWSERKFSTWCRLRQNSEIQTRCSQGVLLGDGTRLDSARNVVILIVEYTISSDIFTRHKQEK